MGWKLKVLVALVGLVLLGSGAWFLGLPCFVYLLVAARPKRRVPPAERAPVTLHITPRHILGSFMVLLSAFALASGGTFSPVAFLTVGGAILLWPTLLRRMSLGELVPVGGSILMRSKYIPVVWCAVAELKAGAEPFAMAASSFSGTMLVSTDTGRTYSLATCRALSRREAETKIIDRFRSATPRVRAGAYLLPLGADDAEAVLRRLGRQIALPPSGLPGAASRVSAFLVLDCSAGSIRRCAAYEVDGASKARLPGKLGDLEGSPLAWEVFDGVGKRTRFPEPDGFSNLLDSMLATKGIPLAERIRDLQSSEDMVRIRTLSGEEVEATRTQLRAVVSIYS